MNSKLFDLKWREVGRGLAVAVFGAVITVVYTGLQSGLTVFEIDWQAVGNTALIAGLSYVMQKFLRNSNDEILKKEKK